MSGLINIPLPVKGGFIPPGGGFGASRAKQSGDATQVHNGIDIAVAQGTQVYAPLDGTVIILPSNDRAGLQMQLQHADGYTTGYAHLRTILVTQGASVKANDIIALSGDSGDAAGHPHLHFTIRKNGVAVDPFPYLYGSNSSVQNNNSIQYTPESTVTNKKKDYVQTIVVSDKYIDSLAAFVSKYNITLTPDELLNYGNNKSNIVNAYTKAQKKQNNNQANINVLNVGTKIEVPLWQMKSNNPYRVNQNLLVNLDYKTFIEAEIGKLIRDPRYKRLNLQGDDGNFQDGMVYKKISQVSVWLWSRVVSPTGAYLIDISPFIQEISTNVSKDGGNFSITMPHVSFNKTDAGKTIAQNNNLTISQLNDLFQLPIININKSESQTFHYSSFISKGTTHSIEAIENGNFKLEPPKKDSEISNDPYYYKRNNSLFHHIIQPNDVIFIRLEKLEIDQDNYFDVKEGYTIIRNSALQGHVFDMIGLIDSAPINVDGVHSQQTVNIYGRDLSKLLIDDGVFFFPVEYAVENREQIIKNSSKSKSGLRLTIPIPPDGNNYYNNLHFNAPGNIISDTRFNFDVTQTISDWLLFIFQQLTNIKICPNNLLNSYKDKTFVISRTDKIASDGSFGYQRLLADGIWQIVKLVTDPNISERRVVDSSLSTDTGSLLNLMRKVCQEPFAEFTSDTYGDKFYFILRKPPYVQASYLTNKVINIFEYDVLYNNLEFEQNFYTWFRLTPMGSIIDSSDGNLMTQLPAVMLPEFVDIWGTKILDIQTNYLDFYYAEAEETQNLLQNILQQANEDLDWLIEAHAYLPFTRTGMLTIKGDRRIKRGMCIRFFPTGEIFHVDAVSHMRNFKGTTKSSTILQISRGMIEKHFDKYFNIVNLKRNGNSKDTWSVNVDIFNFFLNKQQFVS